MFNKKAIEWLSLRGIELEESFTDALKKMVKNNQKINNIKNVESIYSAIGLKKQYLDYWKKHPCFIQQKKLQTQCYFCSG